LAGKMNSSPQRGPGSQLLGRVRQLALDIFSAFKQTLVDLARAVKSRNLTKLVALVKEGSPFESLLDRLLVVVFWVLVALPMVLVPIYYLALSLLG
jgi:hypothetical protein